MKSATAAATSTTVDVSSSSEAAPVTGTASSGMNNSKQTIIPIQLTTVEKDDHHQRHTTINFCLKGTDAAAASMSTTNTNSTNTTKGPTTTFASVTEETSSEGALSARSSDNGQAYEVIEYDYDEDANIIRIENNLSTDDTSELFAEVVGKTAVINIDDDSPAAAALRANAKIHVSSVGKAARAVQLQSVRRALKRATGITKSGNKKGKPPRIPPTLLQLQQQSHLSNNNNNNSVLLSPGPIDVDQYMDAGEMTDHSNNNHHDTLVEGLDEDNADDDDDVVNISVVSNEMDTAAMLHQHGIDEPSFSEIGGEDHLGVVGQHDMDESRNSRLSNKTTTTGSGLKSPPLKSTNGDKGLLTPTPMDRDMMHIPDGVAPGTVEAGKKGKFPFRKPYTRACRHSEVNESLLILTHSFVVSCRHIHYYYSAAFGRSV
jgi:hypothetical protein